MNLIKNLLSHKSNYDFFFFFITTLFIIKVGLKWKSEEKKTSETKILLKVLGDYSD